MTMTRRSVLSALLLAAIAPPPATAAGGALVRLSFHATAEVRGGTIHLSEIAEIACTDAKLMETLRQLDVGSAPLIGSRRTVSVAYARLRIKSAGVRDDQVSFTGPESVAVTRVFQTITSATLLDTALKAVEPPLTGGVAIAGNRPQELKVAPGVLTLKAGAPSLSGTSARVPIEVSVDGQVETTVSVDLRIVPKTRAVVAAHPLTAGVLLSADDLQLAELPQAPGQSFLLDASQALGRQLTVSLTEGAPLQPNQLKLVPLVLRGAQVKVVCRSGSVAIACTGEAQQDGMIGQTIRIRNLASQLDFHARVVGVDALEMVF